MKKALALAMACAMAAGLAACGSGSSSGTSSDTGSTASASGSTASESSTAASSSVTVSGDTIYFGVFEPKTGENGGVGAQEELGIEYANYVRPTVTVGGTTYTIVLDWQDNQSDKTVAATAAQKLISDGCVGILGSYGSGVSIAAGSYFKDAQIPAIGISCTNTNVTLGNEYYFRVCYLDPFQGQVMAQYALDEGYTEVATIDNIGNEYTSGLVNTFTTAFTEGGGTVVDAETFQVNESDFKAILTNIKNSGVKAVFAPTDAVYAPLLLNQAADLGLDVLWMAGDTWYSNVLIQDAGENAEGIVADTFYAEGGNTDWDAGFKAWMNEDSSRLETNLNSDDIVGNQAVAYDAYMVLCDAIEAADSLEGPDIQQALTTIECTDDVVAGTVKFDENGDAMKDTSYICEVKDGAWTFIRTETVE